MMEKAVDESGELGPLNIFNAVTRQNHPSPTTKSSAGRSVFAEVSLRENRGQTPGSQLSRSEGCATDPGLTAASNRKAATVSGDWRKQA
jgi:hypothetical protein